MSDDPRAQPEPAASEAPPSARSTRACELLLGASALAFFAFLARPLFEGEVHTASDLGNFYLPIRDFYAKALAAGHRFTWFPNEFTGFYLHGEGQVGLLHPLNLLQYRVLPLDVAFDLELLRSYAALYVGAFLLLRRFGVPRDASLFGALLAAFPSFTWLHYMHLNIVGAAAHVPWLLLSMDVMLRPRRPTRAALGLAGVVLLTASLAMLGHPQFVFLSAAIEAFALAWALGAGAVPGSRLRAALRWLAAKAAGFAAAGVALVPVADSLATSFRAAPPEGFTSDFNLTPLALVQLFAPYLFEGRAPHENATEIGFWLGAVPTVLVAWALVRRGACPHWRLARAALVLGAVALVLSLGDWGLLYRVQSHLPVVGLFRAPARYVLVVELAAAVVAALAFADLARPGPKVAPRAAPAVLFAPWAVAVALLAVAPRLGVPLTDSPWLRAFGPLAFAAAALLVFLAARGRPAALPLLVALAVVDLGGYGATFAARSEPQTIDAFVSRYRVPERPGVDRLHWGPPALTMKGFRLAGGYVAMTPDRELDLGAFGRPLRDVDARLANALRVSGVRWAIGTRVPEPLPRFRLVGDARQSDDPNRDIAAIDVATTALVDRPVALDPVGDGAVAGEVAVAVDAPGEIDLVTSAPGRRLLVVSESHHEGWRAAVDGEAAAVLRAYGDYMAVPVGAGRHRVALRFEPTSLGRGAWLSAASLAATAVWVAVSWAGARRR